MIRLPINRPNPAIWRLQRACVLTSLVFVVTARSPQARPCLGRDDNSDFMIGDLKQLVSSTDPQAGFQRRDLKIPVVDTATIALVSDPQKCARVLAAFLSTLPESYPTPRPKSVYVVQVGSVYVAMHPPSAGERGYTYAVIDSTFKVISKYSQ